MVIKRSRNLISLFPEKCVIDQVVDPFHEWRVRGSDGVYWSALSSYPISLGIGDHAQVIGIKNTSLLISLSDKSYRQD